MLKRLFGTLCLLFVISIAAFAQAGKAEIKFDKTSHNFGQFSEKQPIQKCTFTFTNTGTAPLVINQAIASCGCTVPAYTKTPILPGKKGEITVTYNGTGKFLGHFKKTITVRSNATTEMTRLQVEGDMEEAKN
jgi:lipoprotein